MRHLAGHGVPVPDPIPRDDGALFGELHGKPAAIVTKLEAGRTGAGVEHCIEVGQMLARLHLAGRDYPRTQPNLRSLPWWQENVPAIVPFITDEQRALLEGELAHQLLRVGRLRGAAGRAVPLRPVPRQRAVRARGAGTGHAVRLGGFFDFYFAGCDKWLFDVAVTVNDWCVDLATGVLDVARADALLRAYQTVRPFTAEERRHWSDMRAGAYRFWVSRLYDSTCARGRDAQAARPRPFRTHPARAHRAYARASRDPHRMQLIEVPAKTGYVWFRQGVWLFRRNPLAFITLFFTYLLAITLISMVPVIGSALPLVFIPGVTVGFMAACRDTVAGKPVMPTILVDGFRSYGTVATQRLLVLGVIYVASMVIVFAASSFVDGGALFHVMMGAADEASTTPEALAAQGTLGALFFATLLYLPVAMLFWFAPVLVAWHDVPPAKALFFSVVSCWRNRGAFVVYVLGSPSRSARRSRCRCCCRRSAPAPMR